jgi:uncharacterized membrane protein
LNIFYVFLAIVRCHLPYKQEGYKLLAYFYNNFCIGSKVRMPGHPLHLILVPFPISFNTATMICCIVYASTGNIFWFHIACIANCAAIVTAAIAVLPGLIDWVSIPGLTDAKATGLKHMVAIVVSPGAFYS